jgi:hypothetical protein
LATGSPRLTFLTPPFHPRVAVAQTKGDLVSLEHIKKPGFKIKVKTKPGAPPEPVLTSPRSVHVCMEAGVDPFTLLERPLESFKQKGLTDDLVKMAHTTHLKTRAAKIDALLKDRAKLPIGFKPDKKKDFAVATKPKKGESAVEAAMKLLGDEKGVEKIKEAAAKVEKQRLKMEADRKRYEALEDQIQREYNAKMAAVNARAAAVKDEMARKEQQRLDDQIAKGKAQAKAAEKFEVDERKHALQKLEEEMAELEVQRKAALREKRKEEKREREREQAELERRAKMALLAAKKENAIEHLRLEVEERAQRLEEFQSELTSLRAERLKMSRDGPNLPDRIKANLERQQALQERHKEELIMMRMAKDAHAAAGRVTADNSEKRAEQERISAEKRARVQALVEAKTRSKMEKIEAHKARQEAYAVKLEKDRKKEAARKKVEEQLKVAERMERVQNVKRRKEVYLARLRDQTAEKMARGSLFSGTKKAMAKERYDSNCDRALKESVAKFEASETLRVATRERWLAAEMDKKRLNDAIGKKQTAQKPKPKPAPSPAPASYKPTPPASVTASQQVSQPASRTVSQAPSEGSMVSYAAAKKLEEEAPAPTEPISSDDPTPPMEPSSGEEFTRSFETEELEPPAEPSAEPEGERTRDTMDSIDDSLEVIHL